MGSLEVVKSVTQEKFVATTELQLGSATDISDTPSDSLEAAKEVMANIGEIEGGILTVKPPMTDEQLELYKTRATDIIVSIEKATAYLDTSRRGRRRVRQLAETAAQSLMERTNSRRPSFQGEGTAVKSY